MFAFPFAIPSRPLGVLLGGSGRTRIPALRRPAIPALLRPLPCPPGNSGRASASTPAGA
jgi:hypothetical protein